jgi:desulfoferrodoxin (superoxide reductase-like protein)
MLMVCAAGPAAADKSAVTLEQGQAGENGTAVITCTVSHRGNNVLHYTQWLRVSADGREIARWDFAWRDRPESEVFVRQVTVDVAEPVLIEAEAHCNIHGSRGAATLRVVPPR